MSRGRVVTRALLDPPFADHDTAASPATPYPGTVTRQGLLTRLVGSGARLVVLSAPAGAGKSTVLHQWAARDLRSHASVRVDVATDDPAALAWRLLDALQDVAPVDPQVFDSAVSVAEPRFSAVLLPSLTAAASAGRDLYVLAVDDAHLLTHPSCHSVLRAVADGVPSGSALVLAMRSSAPTWVSSLRARGELLEIGADAFAFDQVEAERLFEGFGVEPDAGWVAEAVAVTEGWAVGLYLTAVAAADRVDGARPAPPAACARRFVGDYIEYEVLDRLDPEARVFVTRTAVLEELTGPVCDAVTGTPGGQARLDSLRRRLGLLIPVDGRRGAYRYHHLLADAALSALRTQEPGLEPELHRRTARWYAEHDRVDDAVRHAKAAGDLDLTAELIRSDLPANVGGSRAEHLRYRLAGLSEAELARQRWLTLETCWLHLQAGDVDLATRWLLKAQSHVGVDWRAQIPHDPYAAQLALPTALVGGVGLADTVRLCDEALRALPPDEPLRVGLLFLRGASLTLLRDIPAGLSTLEEAERYARALDVPMIVADSLAFRGIAALLTGDSTSAARLIAGGTSVIRENRLDRLATAMHTMTAQALLQALLGDPEGTQTLATARRMTVAGSGMTTWFPVIGRVVQARAAIQMGDGATGRVLLREARHRMTAELRPTLAWDLLVDTESALLTATSSGVSTDSLTSSELRVLQFLPSHLSFRQIGEHLFLSTNTVKSHVAAIYRKFGVSSRAEAVERARTLGLVETVIDTRAVERT